MADFHFARYMFTQANKYGAKSAIRYRNIDSNIWQKKSWDAFAEEIDIVAHALAQMGLKESDKAGQFSQNMAENLVVDFALYSNRAVVIPIYATSSIEQVSYIINDSKLEYLFVGEQQQYDVACEAHKHAPSLKHIIAFDQHIQFSESDKDISIYYSDLLALGASKPKHELVEKRRSEANDNDLGAILYTSGTTGTPKGVMLMHSGFHHAMVNHQQRLTSLSDKDLSIAFLPLTHVFERLWCYLCLYLGIEIAINLRPTDIQATIKEIRPTCMCAVPRFWEKVYIGIKDNLSHYSAFMLGVVTWAIAIGKKYNVDNLRNGKKPHWWLRTKYHIADKFIFSKVKLTLGIENGNIFPTAGAALSDHITLFFRSIGIPICYGYGLTESYATVCCFDYTHYEIGSLGTIMPGLEVKIGEDNEILLKGETVCKGYYNRPDVNAVAFTEDGFFRTGDAGYIKGNTLYLTERIKDLFKTSNGKYIAPQQIETLLTTDKYIEQVAVIGDQRNYVTAIIVPNIPALKEYAQKNSITYQTDEELLDNPKIYEYIEKRIKKLQANMAHFEQIKKFTLIKKGFAIETGELTSTLKLRRAIIQQRYAKAIDAMYEPSTHGFVVK